MDLDCFGGGGGAMSDDGIDLVIKQSNCDGVLVFLIKSLKKKCL